MNEHAESETSSQKGYLSQPMGFVGIISFSIYFVVLALLTVFLLFGFWPGEGAWKNIYIPLMYDVSLVSQENHVSELRLVVLAVLSGALGAFVHGATSFSTYLGNRNLIRSWAIWYILRPFIGMALAVLVYFLLIGGFLSAQANAEHINPYGVCAVSGLAGMFSKQAIDKLHEVFDSLFPSEQSGKRIDKLDVDNDDKEDNDDDSTE